MSFVMIMWNENIQKKQNYVAWIQTVYSFIVYTKTEDICVDIEKEV